MFDIPEPTDRESTHTRVISAPRERVYAAWTTPELLAKWWGPQGFTNTFHECDLRPGGRWRYTMHGPDGTNYENESVFVELARPERVVIHRLAGVHEFHLIGSFEDLGDRTRVTFRQIFRFKPHFETIRDFVKEKNEENLDRLEALVS